MKTKLKVKCPHCTYEWRTKSSLIYITCPSCAKKFKREINSLELIGATYG